MLSASGPREVIHDARAAKQIELIEIPAQRIKFGSRFKLKASLQLAFIADTFPQIIPAKPAPNNRVVDPSHGLEFAEYVEKNKDNWVEPGVLLVSPLPLAFKPLYTQSLPFASPSATDSPVVETGFWEIEKEKIKSLLKWLEGQHRKYGLQTRIAEVDAEISKLEGELVMASDTLPIETNLNRLKGLRDRFNTETIDFTIIFPVDDSVSAEWFVTIARKQRGMNRGERERMDSKTMTVLAAKSVIASHPLFAGSYTTRNPLGVLRVLNRVAKVPTNSDAIFALPNITDIAKNIGFSYGKRVTVKQGSIDLQESIVEMTNNFFDDLVAEASHFSNLVPDSNFTGKDFREKSLYSSSTVIRALADVYHEIALNKVPVTKENGEKVEVLEVNEVGRDLFKRLLRNLNPYMDYELISESGGKSYLGVNKKWSDTMLFRPRAKSPGSAAQELSGLSELLTIWAKSGEVFKPANILEMGTASESSI